MNHMMSESKHDTQEAKDHNQQGLHPTSNELLRVYTLRVYTCGGQSLGQPVLDLEMHSLKVYTRRGYTLGV